MIRIKVVLSLLILGLVNGAFASNLDPYSGETETPDTCTSLLALGSSDSSSWENGCTSDKRSTFNDPYAPPQIYLAKYYTFVVAADMDVQITLDDSVYGSLFYLLDGERGARSIATSSYSLTQSLSAGTYTLEITNRYVDNFTLSIQQVNQGSGQCKEDIHDEETLTGIFTSDCLSNHRASDYNDPYGPVNPSFRAKYYSFTLDQDSDVNLSVNSSTSTFLYLLSGTQEDGNVIRSIYGANFSGQLAAGEYTLEITTLTPNTSGSYAVTFAISGDSSSCTNEMSTGTTNGEFSSSCLLNPNYGGQPDNTDPYAGEDPIRANYYSTSISELTEYEVRINSSQIEPVVNIYTSFGELIVTTKPNYYWSSPASTISFALEPGDYIFEVTAFNELAIGTYSMTINALEASQCINAIEIGESKKGLLGEHCLSQFRGTESDNNDPYSGMNDPYAPQGDYYSKGFEFEITEPKSVRFYTSQTNAYAHLYLAKQNGLETHVFNQTQSTSRNRYEILERHLEPGTYFAEVTTHYAKDEGSFTAGLRELSTQSCESFVLVGEQTQLDIGLTTQCESVQKPSQSYYDPYAPTYTERYYAAYNTFEVTRTALYRIQLAQEPLLPEFFLLNGPSKSSSLLRSSQLNSDSIIVKLNPGYYTVETTTQTPNIRGNTALLVEIYDIDFDGVDNDMDAFPNDKSASVDNDGDLLPDSWNASCDSACQEESSLIIDPYINDSDNDGSDNNADAFPNNPAASVDLDEDFMPDHWASNCDLYCQTTSNLVLDAHINDSDNDGVPNTIDTDHMIDNGNPNIISAPKSILFFQATGAYTLVPLSMHELETFDNIDSHLDIEVSLNDTILDIDDDNNVELPSGALSLSWVAIDDAGNRSDAVMQTVNIFPLVSFNNAITITGEASDAILEVSLSGPSPVYPVTIELGVNNELSDADTSDIVNHIDLDALSITIENDEQNVASIAIPIFDDAIIEADEWLVLSITDATSDQYHLNIDANAEQHNVIITDANLAPEVELSFSQNNVPITTLENIPADGGEVTISADIVDPNGNDTHTYLWIHNDIPRIDALTSVFIFDPMDISAGSHTINLTVHDNGNPILSTEEQEIHITVIPPDVETTPNPAEGRTPEESTAEDSSTPKENTTHDNRDENSSQDVEPPQISNGGGPINGMLLLLLLMLSFNQAYFRYRNTMH